MNILGKFPIFTETLYIVSMVFRLGNGCSTGIDRVKFERFR